MATSVTPTPACRASRDSTRRRLPPDLALGLCYLCALPSTISSSVALTSLARGNVPAAIFNATLSSVLGIAITPLLVGLLACRLGFSTEDEITAVFCGSRKTLASGVPMATLLLGANPAIGLIMLTIMFYHQIQLFVRAPLAKRHAQRWA